MRALWPAWSLQRRQAHGTVGDAKLPELRPILGNCPKARSQSIHDRCKVRYGEDSRPGPGVMIEPPRDDSPRTKLAAALAANVALRGGKALYRIKSFFSGRV
jgi:hypothetical protein